MTSAVLSNLFPININSDAVAHRYQVSIKVTTKKGKTIVLAKNEEKSSEFERWYKQYVCYEILREIMKFHYNFKQIGIGLVYDKGSRLYSSQPLQRFEEKYEVIVEKEKWSENLQQFNFMSFTVTIEPIQTLFLNDPVFFSVDCINRRENHDLRGFIELLTSQPGVDSDAVLDRPKAFYLKDVSRNVGYGIVLLEGARKGSRVVKNADGQLQMKLSVEPVISAFYQEGILTNNMMEFFDRLGFKEACELLLKVYKNCWLCYEFNLSKRLHLRELSDGPLSELCFIDDNGKKVFVVDYYKEQYGYQLEYVNFPAIVETKQGKKFYYPPELLYVVPKKVAQTKLDVILPVDMILKANAVKPQDRLKKTMDMLEVLDSTTRLFEKFGIRIDRENNTVPMKIAKFPIVQFGHSRCEPDTKKTVFRPGFFIDPAIPPRCWAIVQGFRVFAGQARQLVGKFLSETQFRGKQWPEPAVFVEFDTYASDFKQWKKLFEYLKNNQVEFVCFLDLSTTRGNHHIIKLCERLFEVLTQQITTVTLQKLRNFHNPIAKTNCKIGGLNYLVIPESQEIAAFLKLDKILIVGIDVAHPTDLSSNLPSTVGIASNTGKHVNGFIGNYIFQDARQENVATDMLEKMVGYMLSMRANLRPDSPTPELILVFRDGLSEGQMSMALQDECVAIQKGFCQYYPGTKPEVLFVVATKRHNRRFYRLDGKNLDPGSVMSEGVARAFADEFYMQSAFPLQGTGKTTDYETLVNSKEFSHEEIVNFSFALCFGHQIVCSATSQPTPIMVAHESAKRGYNNVKTYMQFYEVPMVDGELNLDILNTTLSYVTSTLGSTRFNA